MHVFVAVVFVTLFHDGTFAQTNYDLSKQHKELCEEIHKTSKLYELRGKWDDAIKLLKIGIEISQREEGSKRSEAMLKSQLGTIYRLQRKFDDALAVLTGALTLAESVGDKKIVGDCLFFIGYTYDHKQLFNDDGDYDVARDYYEKSLAVRESIEDEQGIGFSIFRLGRLVEMQGDDEAASTYYARARAIVQKHGFKVLANYVYAHQGFISERKGNLDEALRYAQLVLEINREIGFKYDDPLSFLNLGSVYLKMGNRDAALTNYFKSISSAEEINVRRSLPWSFYSIAELYYEEAKYDNALHYYEKTVSSANELGIQNSAVTSALSKIRSMKEAGHGRSSGKE